MMKDPDATQTAINPNPSLIPDAGKLKKSAAQAGARLYSETKKNTRDYGKPKFFEAGGAVKPEFDPDDPGRAGSRGLSFSDTGEPDGWKDPYPRQQEVSPSDSKDRNRVDPRDMYQDKHDSQFWQRKV